MHSPTTPPPYYPPKDLGGCILVGSRAKTVYRGAVVVEPMFIWV